MLLRNLGSLSLLDSDIVVITWSRMHIRVPIEFQMFTSVILLKLSNHYHSHLKNEGSKFDNCMLAFKKFRICNLKICFQTNDTNGIGFNLTVSA